MSRLSALAYPNGSPIHGLTDKPLAYFQRVLGVAPSPLALAEALQHTLLATQTSAVATTTCLDYLHPHTRAMRPSTASPIYLSPTSTGYWVWRPRPSLPDHTRQHPLLATKTSIGSGNHDMSILSTLAYPNDAPIHGLTDIPPRLLPTDIECGALAPRSRRDTATQTARD
jgi:hypothetical protein